MTDFAWGVKNGDLSVVEKFVTDKNSIVNEEISGRFPLHFAADYGQHEVIKYLVEKGAKVDAPDKHGITPLLAAIWENHVKAVRVLIESGANKNGRSPDGKTYIENSESAQVTELLK